MPAYIKALPFFVALMILACGPYATAADLPSSRIQKLLQGDPLKEPSPTDEQAITNLEVRIMGMDAIRLTCAERLPRFTQQNLLAYTRWRQQHASLLERIEAQFEVIMLRNANGDTKLATQAKAQVLAEVEQSVSSALGTIDSRALENFCGGYPKVLEN